MSSLAATQPIASTSYIPPVKRVLSQSHLAAFKRSSTHQEIVKFVAVLNEAVIGKKLAEAVGRSKVSQLTMGHLLELMFYIDDEGFDFDP